MNIQQIAGIVAAIISICSMPIYIKSILRGETKPERAGWAIWLVVSFLVLISYYASGARETILLNVTYVLYPLIVFTLSFKYGVGGFTKFDIYCLIGAAIGVAVWIYTRDSFKALLINTAIDSIGLLPTLKKVYRQPQTENKLSWQLGMLAAFVNLFAITTFDLSIALYPIVAFIGITITTFLVTFPKMRVASARAAKN